MGDVDHVTTSRIVYKTVSQLCAELDALTSWFSEHRVLGPIKTAEEDSTDASSEKTPHEPSSSNSGSFAAHDSGEEEESLSGQSVVTAVHGPTPSYR